MRRLTVLPVALLLAVTCSAAGAASQCYGTVASGRLEGGVKLPSDGPNFGAYSMLAATMGRTYLHSHAARIVVDAYAAVDAARPGLRFVYGETGLRKGGRFAPHKTHQNGLSIDFFVPVRDSAGRSVALPTEPSTRFGYDLEFDSNGTFGQYQIDYEAIGEHLYQLDIVAKKQGAGIAKVIFDLNYLPKLYATARGPYLRRHVTFMKSQPWVRHDEHYHVDFAIACKA